MVTVIKSKKLRVDGKYEPPMKVGFGIDSSSVENTNAVMGYTTAAAGDKLQRHYHTNTSVVQYVVKGRTLMSFGPDHEKKEVIVEPGDFIFIPRGEIHGAACLEDGAVVFCYTEVASKEDAGTIFIEPPHKK